jgi:hypothetical protein
MNEPGAVTLTVRSRFTESRQELYAHSICVVEHVTPRIPFDPELFSGEYD